MSVQRIASEIEPAPPFTLSPAPCIGLSVDLKHDDDVLVVRISGELDMATAVVLEDAMRPYLGPHTSVSYDLADLTFIDCAGLRALLTPADGDPSSNLISITSASRCVRRLLDLLELQSMIDTSSTGSPQPTSIEA